MDKMMFNQVIPRIRVMETRLLDRSKLERMIDADTPFNSLKVLQETEYASLLNRVQRPEEYDTLLRQALNETYDSLYSMITRTEPVDFMALKYDYHNLKVLLKAKLSDKDFSDLLFPIGTVEADIIKYALENEDYRALNDYMVKAIVAVLEDFEELKEPQNIDIILDKYYFENLLSISKSINEEYLSKYLRILIDLTNIKIVLRIKALNKGREFLSKNLIDGGNIKMDKLNILFGEALENIHNRLAATNYVNIIREGIEYYINNSSLALLEKNIENYIMDYMKRAKTIPFGIEPIIGYLYAKENEIKLLRIIMVGQLNNVSPEVIRERLRDSYV
ncbi:V-type ATP synthase subunit C [Alloiococcus sp. CFN-8]|uniref:V-type ATP synthase subunit C n=1 Tax=Alloiococcus sp. CFN-8 TaxID=3416081 RepID=UPI003CFB8656